jgi:hypothetical protein
MFDEMIELTDAEIELVSGGGHHPAPKAMTPATPNVAVAVQTITQVAVAIGGNALALNAIGAANNVAVA